MKGINDSAKGGVDRLGYEAYAKDESSADSLLKALKKVNSHYDLSVFCIAYMKRNVSL